MKKKLHHYLCSFLITLLIISAPQTLRASDVCASNLVYCNPGQCRAPAEALCVPACEKAGETWNGNWDNTDPKCHWFWSGQYAVCGCTPKRCQCEDAQQIFCDESLNPGGPNQCTTNCNCTEGRICINGWCQGTEDLLCQCVKGKQTPNCDESRNSEGPGKCKTSCECAEGQFCSSKNACLPNDSCDSDSDCGSGMICGPFGQCETEAQCCTSCIKENAWCVGGCAGVPSWLFSNCMSNCVTENNNCTSSCGQCYARGSTEKEKSQEKKKETPSTPSLPKTMKIGPSIAPKVPNKLPSPSKPKDGPKKEPTETPQIKENKLLNKKETLPSTIPPALEKEEEVKSHSERDTCDACYSMCTTLCAAAPIHAKEDCLSQCETDKTLCDNGIGPCAKKIEQKWKTQNQDSTEIKIPSTTPTSPEGKDLKIPSENKNIEKKKND